MFCNQYDNDVTVWSPAGRLHQVEYAMKTVKLGSAVVGLKNKTHAILIALKRTDLESSVYQKKIVPIDAHVGIAMAGLTIDARMLSSYMRTECLYYKYSHVALLPVSRLMSMLGSKMQINTQMYDRRPYGVGFLVAGYDDQGPHIYQTCPSANYLDCKAMAIGSRSEIARTYLEKHLDEFSGCSLEELIKHGLGALRGILPNEVELNTNNVSIAAVGENTLFEVLDQEQTSAYLKMIEREERCGKALDAATGGDDEPQSPPGDDNPEDTAMETD